MEKTDEQKALEIGQLMVDGKANDVVVLDISGLNSWADYFVIATVTSNAHAGGLYKTVLDYAKKNDLKLHLTHEKSSDGDEWNLVDLGNVIVHLMSDDARKFYELEKLWHAGKVLELGK